ncbi:hypothetical protein H6P81_005814 [Aristolochia fimbriata]|uniref:RING-type domain-containing protein n=1 Tax=Aristolochia fimbriata TaxID=158543 RepID=A0AAV7EVI1_ARIFI|nr:hypothetical protein H6P81_005814 [Aristolochia fimbriata]
MGSEEHGRGGAGLSPYKTKRPESKGLSPWRERITHLDFISLFGRRPMLPVPLFRETSHVDHSEFSRCWSGRRERVATARLFWYFEMKSGMNVHVRSKYPKSSSILLSVTGSPQRRRKVAASLDRVQTVERKAFRLFLSPGNAACRRVIDGPHWVIGISIDGFRVVGGREMGSGGSKEAGTSSADGVRGTRLRGARVFHSPCLGGSSASTSDDETVSSPEKNQSGRSKTQTFSDQARTNSHAGQNNSCGKTRSSHINQVSSDPPNAEPDECGRQSIRNLESGAENSSTQTTLARAPSRVSRTCSKFSFMRNNISFRLTRAASMGSLGSYSLFSTNHPVSNPQQDFDVDIGSSSSVNEFFPSPRLQDPPAILQVGPASIPVHVPVQDSISSQEVASDDYSRAATSPSVNRYSQRNYVDIANNETRPSHRRYGAQEPAEGSIRFSRAMSVGRLSDRVLCRTSLSEGIFGHLQEDRDPNDTRQGNGRPLWDYARRGESSDGNMDILASSSSYHISSTSGSTHSSQDNQVDTSSMREARHQALVEHRTAFLERRRRIRSQVRALQRLGSRFENLSGHDRSCILSGHHRSGRCTCRASGRAPNPDEDVGTRASISRIVMLAEALFEVLDEIHQQSVTLSSRPSVSSIGSVPAPKELVDCMPVKIFSKPRKHQIEETAQCYICLLEYEEGDCMRILPCHHDFHQPCIDKWLKEIHRVCPLCRGDVCRSGL